MVGMVHSFFIENDRGNFYINLELMSRRREITWPFSKKNGRAVHRSLKLTEQVISFQKLIVPTEIKK